MNNKKLYEIEQKLKGANIFIKEFTQIHKEEINIKSLNSFSIVLNAQIQEAISDITDLYDADNNIQATATLQYNEDLERYNNFNCGECFKIKVNDKWKDVRIEYDTRWYLIDEDNFTISCKQLEGADIKEY